MSGRTIILISHDPMAVRGATEIMLLENGRVAERGSHVDLLEREGLYARLFDAHHVAARVVEP
jgi:ABC-type multidrug transport system fused ATPase/permease subunit